LRYLRAIGTLILLISAFYISAQQAFLKVDKLEHIYSVNGDLLEKHDKFGNKLFSFSYKNSGNISSIDVNDPLKIMVFYKDLGQVLFLDNTLSITQNPFSLHAYEISEPILVCSSSDKGLWILDRYNMTLSKIDFNLQLVHSIPNINLIIGKQIAPVEMFKAGKNLFINDPENGIFVFDTFGSFIRTIPIKNISSFNVSGNKLFYYDNHGARIFDMKSYTEHAISLPDIPFSAIAFGSSFICLWDQSMSAFHIKILKD